MLCDWHARGVPLSLVREIMEERLARHSSKRARGDAGLRSLRYIAPAVEEAWQVIVSGRTAEAHAEIEQAQPADAGVLGSTTDGQARVATRRRWQACRSSAPEDGALRQLLDELLQRLEHRTPGAEVDRVLDTHLLAAVSAELRRTAECDVDEELAGYRGRMDPATLGATRQRAVVERLRRLLGLPRLSHR